MATPLSDIRLLLLDVDGILTRGEIIYNDRGEETKQFSVKDGLGIRLLMDAGIPVGIVTGRASDALRHRLKNLGIDLVFDGVKDKALVVSTIEEKTGIPASAMAFMGDDLPDLRIMRRVGTAITVADASSDMKSRVDHVTHRPGGYGAVREMAEAILKAKDLWETVLAGFDR